MPAPRVTERLTDRGVPRSVLGAELEACSDDPLTGRFRDGCCNTDGADCDENTVCAVMTAEFLELSASVGHDLATPRPAFGFERLKPGDQWCLSASCWAEALDAAAARPAVLEAIHVCTLEWVSRRELEAHRFDPTIRAG